MELEQIVKIISASWQPKKSEQNGRQSKRQPGQESGQFQSVSIDTRTLSSGDLFIALCGPNFDGHDFIKEAEKKKGPLPPSLHKHPQALFPCCKLTIPTKR